jgi:hypothetical protein
MATNEQVIEQLRKLEDAMVERIKEVDEKATKNDEALRGNGGIGLKAQVAENTKMLNEIRWYFRGVLLVVVGDFVSHILNIY